MKDEIRKKLKKTRLDFCGIARQRADEAIFKNFTERFGGYNSFFIYNSISGEADTSKIISALRRDGKSVFLPRVEGKDMVAVTYGHMRKGAFGIEEPTGQAFEGNIDVTVIPLIAVNKRGYRIGYGKGFYDRYLKNRDTVKVGLCYSFQIADFKEDEWDVPLDYIISEKGIYLIE